MQVEYERPPWETVSTIPTEAILAPPMEVDPDLEDEGEEEPEPEHEHDQEPEQEGEDAAPKEKKKRIIKQRQSLAEKRPGTTIFPISRIKRIVKADKDLDMMTGEATFMVAVATEYFIKHFMEEGYTKARLDKRRIVNYKDMAAVVARSEEFDFLRDVVPMPILISEALERRKQKQSMDEHDLHSDAPSGLAESDLPPLQASTNPLFPGAIVKKPPNTHAKTSVRAKPVNAATEGPPESAASSTEGVSKVPGGKNGPSTPHSLTTRSGRRSIAGGRGEVESPVAPSGPIPGSSDVEGPEANGAEDERMDED